MAGAVRVVVDLLVAGDYEEIERSDRGGPMTAASLTRAIGESGRTLAPPGDGWWDAVTLTRAHSSARLCFHAVVPLWTLDDGPSDLCLELELTQLDDGEYATAVLNVHDFGGRR